MNAWTLPDGRLLATEHAYRQEALRAATRPLPDVRAAVGRLVRAARRPATAARRTTVAARRPARRGPAGRDARPTLPPCDVTLGHSAVCR